MYNRFKKSVLGMAVTATATAAVSSLTAGEPGKAVIDDKAPIEGGWTVCDIFNHNTLYEGEGFVKSVKFTGRYHGGFIDTGDDYLGGGESEAWDHRRFRAGVVAKLENDITIQSIYNLDTSPNFDGDRFVDNIDEFFIQWDPSDDFYVILGKQKQNILSEYRKSSNALFVYERSALTQNLLSQKLWGAAVGFKGIGLNHEIGLWGTAFGDDFSWPSFDEVGASLTYRVKYELDEATTLFFDYQYDDQDRSTSEIFAGSPYENVFAVGTESKWGRLGLNTDVIFALDRQDGRLSPGDDSHGFQVTPYYDLTDKLQLVARYAYLSDGRVGRPQQFASRPEVDGLGTLFVGVNYAICKTKLRIQAGYEWANADRIVGTGTEYSNDSWLIGIRTHW
jgi:phosphate-selective porin OprO and OprP